MPSFCRHNRFLDRCPICSKTLPGHAASSARPSSAHAGSTEKAGRRGGVEVRIRREGRALDDGYRSELLPGLRASADAASLADEIAFSSGRLQQLRHDPPGLYRELRTLGRTDLERATWICFLIAYLSPLQGGDPFSAIRLAAAAGAPLEGRPDLEELPLGPRSSHEPSRASGTLDAYSAWVRRESGLARGQGQSSPALGAQEAAFVGDPAWSPERRFQRIFERLALPGFPRMGRYELLLVLGGLGLYELRPHSLHLAGAAGLSARDPTTLAAKRVFAIADPLLLERRAAALAAAIEVPIETLELALGNWASPQRATLGFAAETDDPQAGERARSVLGI